MRFYRSEGYTSECAARAARAGRLAQAGAAAGLAFAGILVSLAAPAQAGDVPGPALKDPLPDSLTWHGVTLYGTIDVAYAYQTHGAPLDGAFYTGLEYIINGSKNANQAISTLTNSSLEQSKIGLKFEEPIAEGWGAIGKIEAAFNPVSGEIADNCASMVRNNGTPLIAQDANSDGSRCGQAFSGPAYAGVTSATYGTLTAGRQQSLSLDATSVYDPMGLSAAFSLIGYSSGTASGPGATETSRWDNSVKYTYQYGPAHAAAMYTGGGPDTAIFNGAYGFNAGGTWRGFSADANYTLTKGAVASAPFGASSTCPGTGCVGNVLSGTITDNEAWSLMAKYGLEPGFLGGETAGDKLTVFAGYVHTTLANPEDAVAAGSATLGGYVLSSINNQPYALGSERLQQTFWTGLRYDLPSGLNFTGAYYRLTQNAFEAYAKTIAGNYINQNCRELTATNAANKTAGKYQGNPLANNCAGDYNQGSFLIDYRFNKHLDVYAGITYSENSGGLNSGYLNSNMTTFVVGTRLKF